MHGVYEALEKSGKIGHYHMVDGKLQPKPHQEYPKWVTKADGKRVLVKDLREEAEMAGELGLNAPHDPLRGEKDRLAAESEKLTASLAEVDDLKAQMRAQLEELATARAALQDATGTAKAQPVPPQAFRLPPDAGGAKGLAQGPTIKAAKAAAPATPATPATEKVDT